MHIDHSKALSEHNRRTRTSAAVIGLAMSMGAQGLLLPQAVEAATVAADSAANGAVGTALPASFDLATVASSGDASPSRFAAAAPEVVVVNHKVQEGQTLSKIARLYQVDAAAILSANALAVDTVLRVGQVLQIPVDARIARLVDAANTPSDAPVYYGLVPGAAGETATPNSLGSGNRPEATSNAALKLKQDEAIARLQQKRESLRLGLRQLPTSQSPVETTISARSAIASAPTSQTVQSRVLPAAEKSGEKSAKSNVIAVLTPDLGAASNPTYAALTHRVEIGQTLNSIARTYGVSAQQLVEANRISDPNSIFVDQVLAIPQSFTRTTPSTAPVLGASKFGVARAPQPDVAQAESDRVATSFQPGMPVPAAASAASDPNVMMPFTGGVSAPEASVSRSRHDYVESLRMEIVQLRDRYKPSDVSRTHSASDTLGAAPLNSAPKVAARVAAARNPEFTPNVHAESLRTQIRKLNGQHSGQAPKALSQSAPSAPSEKGSTVVAIAPVGSQSYDPVIGKNIGRLVSPDLPPLGSGDAYFPSGSGKFNGYIWPAKGMLTSGYGPRWGRMHRGIDVAAPTGTPVVAAAPGVVITAGWNSGGYGNLVEIQHADGSVTLYGHNDRILVREGQQVAQGQQISEMGSTGYSTGPHCHFEVHLPGQGAVNPVAYLPREGA